MILLENYFQLNFAFCHYCALFDLLDHIDSIANLFLVPLDIHNSQH